jgi:hypothetical protein
MGKPASYSASLFILVTMLGAALTACGAPSFVNHTPPELTVDFEPFEDSGCPLDRYNFRRCEADSPLAALGCDEIRQVDLLGGLDPPYPIAECLSSLYNGPEERDYLFRRGCMEPVAVRYVVWREDEFHLIETDDELRALFAPIETAEEALSFALAVQGSLSARYGLTYQPESTKYLAGRIQDTHVESLPDGYLVHLFYREYCGCSYHETAAVDVHVTEQGYLEEVKRQAVYRDLLEMCID